MSTNENLLIGQGEHGTIELSDDKKQKEIIFEYNGIIQGVDDSRPGDVTSETEFGFSIFQRFREDLKFRHRLLHTLCIGWSMVALVTLFVCIVDKRNTFTIKRYEFHALLCTFRLNSLFASLSRLSLSLSLSDLSVSLSLSFPVSI